MRRRSPTESPTRACSTRGSSSGWPRIRNAPRRSTTSRRSCSSWRGARSASRRRRDIATITDDDVDGVPIRIYRVRELPTGLVVYFHGGGYVIGSIGLMDNVARELAHAGGAVVVSVGYRLAPEDPYPAGLDDCERVTRWAFANAERFGVSPPPSRSPGRARQPGGRRALRLRDAGDASLAGQALVYPTGVGHDHVPVGGRVRRPRHQSRRRGEVLGGVQRRA